jgi:hypothetical protein
VVSFPNDFSFTKIFGCGKLPDMCGKLPENDVPHEFTFLASMEDERQK